MKVHFITHESFEAPAALTNWVESRGLEATYTHLFHDDPLPKTCEHFDFLIVMGGPQSPATTQEECAHFDAAEEIKLITQVVRAKKRVLGVCLGAQLLGEACGGTFDSSPHREIGVFPIKLTEAAKDDPIFTSFPEEFLVGHWHNDMPGLTEDAVLLASSQGCPRQIVRYAPHAYGFQCHFEFTENAINNMITRCASELENDGSELYVQAPDLLRQHNYKEINARLFEFLDAFCEINCKVTD
jgi:GMP synthase (glutamine-hydrolysing)